MLSLLVVQNMFVIDSVRAVLSASWITKFRNFEKSGRVTIWVIIGTTLYIVYDDGEWSIDRSLLFVQYSG